MAWHDATCATLDLEWEDGQPGCRKCERKAPKLAPVHPISPPAPPPDTPRSELICTWPPSLFSQGQAGGHEDSDTLAHILANIDEWTGTGSTRPSQRELKSDKRSPQQQPLNPSEPNFLFQGIYSRLPNANSIRLLRLHGSEDTNDPVCGTLENHRLHDPCRPIFEAFSYTWADSQGNSSLCETIFLGPQYDVLPVTKNCLAALRRFRTAIDRLVWVDAICINQFDLKERGHQVSLMKDIYTSAARVLIYLGDSDGGAESAIVPPQKNDQLPGDSSRSHNIDSRAILQTPYFSRIWVIQEVMLNKTGSVAYGNHTMHLKDLQSSVDTLFRTKGAGRPINWLEYLTKMKEREDLYKLLLATKDCHCGDLRDRIYGLMGLVTEEEAERLPIDYNLSVQQLYTGLAMYWLTNIDPRSQSRPLDIFKRALLPKITPFLPSWVPDWALQLDTVASQKYTLSTYLTFQFGNTLLWKSSGLDWARSSDLLFGSNSRKINWEWKQYPPRTPEPVKPFKLLPRSGTLALDAGHIFSTPMGKVELTDAHGKLLHGLQVANSGAFGPKQENVREHDLHIHYLPDFEVAIAARKHSDRVYGLHGLFCLTPSPLDGQFPSNVNDIINFYPDLVRLEFRIVDDWLMNSFFYGACADSAYAHTHIRNDWSKHFPLALALCQASNFSYGTLYGELHKRSILPVMMEICEDVLAFLDEEPVSKEPALRRRPRSVSLPPGTYYIPLLGDTDLTTRIQEALAARKLEALSPQKMCTYLRNVVKGHQDSCKHYVPLQNAQSDLEDDVHQLSMLVTLGKSPRHPIPLLLSKKKIVSLQTVYQTEQPYQITQAFIVWRARSLLSRLTIDPKFTLEQNFNITWIYVSTMEMVARLRGVLQQWLILKAIQDKMMNRQKIYII